MIEYVILVMADPDFGPEGKNREYDRDVPVLDVLIC